MTNLFIAFLCAFVGWIMLLKGQADKTVIAIIFLTFSVAFVLLQFFDRPKRTPATHEQIAALAKRKWEQAGQPGGRDEEFWLAAEKELNG